MKYGTLNDLQRKLEEAELAFANHQRDAGSRMLREEVTEDDIAEIIAKWTGIPVSKLRQSEKYLFLMSSLSKAAPQIKTAASKRRTASESHRSR